MAWWLQLPTFMLRSFLPALVTLVACGNDFPDPPDLSPLIAAYQTPTADLDRDRAQQLDAAVATAAELFDLFGVDNPIAEGTTEPLEQAAGTSPEAGGDRERPFGLEGDGFARIHWVCPGWESHDERTAETTGVIDSNVRFSEKGLDAVIWGVADRCAMVAAGAELLLDGELAITYAGGLLLSLDADLEVSGERVFDREVDFRIGAGGFEVRHRFADGDHLIVVLGVDGLRLRAANGEFGCADGRCVNRDGVEVVLP